MQVYWLAFSDSRGEGFPTLSCAATDFGARMIRVQSGFSSEKLIAWLKLLRPDVVHHQGPLRIQVMRVCNALKIPFITGFHFWSGAIELNPSFGNVDILQVASVFFLLLRQKTDRGSMIACRSPREEPRAGRCAPERRHDLCCLGIHAASSDEDLQSVNPGIESDIRQGRMFCLGNATLAQPLCDMPKHPSVEGRKDCAESHERPSRSPIPSGSD